MSEYSFSTQPSETIAVLLASTRAQTAMELRGVQPAAHHQTPTIFLHPCTREGAVVWESMQAPHTTYDLATLSTVTTNWLLLTDQHAEVLQSGQATKTVHIDSIADADIAPFIDFLLRHYSFDAATALDEVELDNFFMQPNIRYGSFTICGDSQEQFQADIDQAFAMMASLLRASAEYAHVVLEAQKGKLRLSMGRYIQERLKDYEIVSPRYSASYCDYAAPAMQCHFLLSH